MAVTILEALQNAEINLIQNGSMMFARKLGEGQLKNAIRFLEKGYSPDEEIDPLLEQWPNPEDAPRKAAP